MGMSSIYSEWTTRMVSNIDTRLWLRILTSGAGGCWRRPRREALGAAGSGLSYPVAIYVTGPKEFQPFLFRRFDGPKSLLTAAHSHAT